MIRLIAPFINLIPLFIVFWIMLITPFIPLLTAPPIALASDVPKWLKVDFILSHKPLKKLPQVLNTPFTAVQALLNMDLNHAGAPLKMFLIYAQRLVNALFKGGTKPLIMPFTTSGIALITLAEI